MTDILRAARRAVPRAAPVDLDAEQLRFSAMAVELSLHTIAADENSPRQMTIACGFTLATCPVQALRYWLRSSGTRFGPVFRKVDRRGSIEQRRLGTDAIRRILARRTPCHAASKCATRYESHVPLHERRE